jgi:lysozyme family protein
MLLACVTCLVVGLTTWAVAAVRRRPAARHDVDRFAACLAPVLAAEGGFVDNPADPGGATRYGITRATLAAWRGHAVTVDAVRALGRREAEAIYRARYWAAMRCPELPPGIDLMAFDCAVNAGPRRSALILQAALGVAEDGLVGPVTVGAAVTQEPTRLIAALAEARLAFCRGLSTWPTFGRGWQRRVEAMQEAALAMARA